VEPEEREYLANIPSSPSQKNGPIADNFSGTLDTGYLPQILNRPPWLHKEEDKIQKWISLEKL
jgi:hypothetical protein